MSVFPSLWQLWSHSLLSEGMTRPVHSALFPQPARAFQPLFLHLDSLPRGSAGVSATQHQRVLPHAARLGRVVWSSSPLTLSFTGLVLWLLSLL